MAKKQAKPMKTKTAPAEAADDTGGPVRKRKGPLTFENMKAASKRLKKLSTSWSELVSEMESDGFSGDVRVDGSASVLDLIDTLIDVNARARAEYDKT